MAAMTFKRLRIGLLLASCCVVLPSCEMLANANFYSDQELEPLSAQAYDAATQETGGKVTSGKDYEMVQRVAQKIAAVAEEPSFQWEARLLQSDVPNAFCLPNGRIAIYTGILPITQNEAGLAVVMGHEVAHATLRHGGKRMTQGTIQGGVLQALGAGMSMTSLEPSTQNMLMAGLGVGGNVLWTLPYSRSSESEADIQGLRYAIRAGYDPNEAPKLWQRMAQLGGSGGPAWMSTHPASEERAAALAAAIPRLIEEEKNWQPKPVTPAPGAAPQKQIAPGAIGR
jgi:predicted Zn-dependent protease